MADFNGKLMDLQNKTSKIQMELTTLLREYDSLYREANTTYIEQKMASGNEGLEDFQKFLMTIRRNRDVFGSLAQGAKSVRPMGHFKFIEDDLTQEKRKKSPAQVRRQRKEQSVPVELDDVVVNEKELEVLDG
jgi:hypothetical protein